MIERQSGDRTQHESISAALERYRRERERAGTVEGPAESQRAHEDEPQNERHPAFMTDEEFDALPCWSDVEDDPEYNTM